MDDGKRHAFGGGMFGKDSATYDVYLNLTPLMDVMSNILFFLLAAFGSSLVAILPVTVPLQSSGTTSIEADADKITLTVRAERGRLIIGCGSETLPPEVREICKSKIENLPDGRYDLARFTAALRAIKERFPGSTSMIMVPDDDIEYDMVIRIMDSARELRAADNGIRTVLFPDVVLSGIFGGTSRKATRQR